MNKLYKVGIYCRLSVDDASNSAKAKNYIPADESVSIENQWELLSKFAMLNGWVETKTYCDESVILGTSQETLVSQGFPDLVLFFVWAENSGPYRRLIGKYVELSLLPIKKTV